MQKRSVPESIIELAARMGPDRFVEVCIDLLGGAARERYVEELRGLTGLPWNPGDAVFDQGKWKDYWPRTWGARGLLYVWDDSATDAIVKGLMDEHYRPAEMCLKVATRYEVVGTGDGAAILSRHELPRVRVQALRCLAVNGDSQHVATVEDALNELDSSVYSQAFLTWKAFQERFL